MSLTGGLPLRHPAVALGALIVGLGYAILFFEEHLRSVGELGGRGGPFTLVMAMIAIPGWAWLLLSMIGQPDLFYEGRATLANAETVRSRLRSISMLGYAFMLLTLVGLLAFVWKYLR